MLTEGVEVLESLKQQLSALNNRLKRYTTRENQFQQNNMFENSPDKLFYIKNPPSCEYLDKFWRPLFETTKKFNK